MEEINSKMPPPLCCLPSATTKLIENSVKKKHSKIAGLQQLFACCIMVLATFNGHTFGWAFFLPNIRKEINLSRSSLAVSKLPLYDSPFTQS